MRVVINALPIRWGGGLTVICALAKGIHETSPDWHITILASSQLTFETASKLECVNEVARILPDGSYSQLFLWQNTRLGSWLRRHHCDVVVNINYYVAFIRCAQVVYHVNLLRFLKVETSRGLNISEWIRDRSASFALRRATANVFESQYLRDVAEKAVGRIANNGSVVYLGLPDELISAVESVSPQNATYRRLVSITNSVPHKDNPTLIRTLARLVALDAESDWRLEIAGGMQAESWEPTRRLARELGVYERINWHGYCESETLANLLRNSICMVATSQVESFAMVALEAMAHGCPPIVADCAAMPESVGNAGLLAHPGSPDAFAQQILKLAVNPELHAELILRGKQWLQRFRWSKCGQSFRDILAKLHLPN